MAVCLLGHCLAHLNSGVAMCVLQSILSTPNIVKREVGSLRQGTRDADLPGRALQSKETVKRGERTGSIEGEEESSSQPPQNFGRKQSRSYFFSKEACSSINKMN